MHKAEMDEVVGRLISLMEGNMLPFTGCHGLTWEAMFDGRVVVVIMTHLVRQS
jgi:hypothetical protein